MGNLLNVKLGVCKVVFKGVDLGHTIGGVEVTYSPEFQETKVDQYTGIAERWLIGEKLSAKVPLAESSLVQLKAGLAHGTEDGESLTLGKYAGQRSSTLAGLLVLHPVANADNDLSDDVAIFKAHSSGEVTLPFKNDGERIIETTFDGMVDESRADGSFLGLIGDSTS